MFIHDQKFRSVNFNSFSNTLDWIMILPGTLIVGYLVGDYRFLQTSQIEILSELKIKA